MQCSTIWKDWGGETRSHSLFPEVHWFDFSEQNQRVKTVKEQHYRHDDCDQMVKECDFAEQPLGNCRIFKLIEKSKICEATDDVITFS